MSWFSEQRLDEADEERTALRFTTSPVDGRSVRLGYVRRRRSTGNNAALLNLLFSCFLFRAYSHRASAVLTLRMDFVNSQL